MLRRDAKWRRWVQVGFILGGAALTGSCEIILNSDNLSDWHKGAVQSLWFVGLAAILLGGAILVLIDQTAPEVLAEADIALSAARDLQIDAHQKNSIEVARLQKAATDALASVDEAERTIADLADDIERAQEAGLRLATLYSITRSALLEGVETMIAARAASDDNRRALIGVVLDSFSLFSNRLFGFLDEYWALTVFIPLTEPDRTERLACYTTRRSFRNEEQKSHRRWEKGEGCAGLAWEDCAERIIPDIAEESNLRVRKENKRDDDVQRHRSLAAVPIVVGSNVVGVLCASSSTPNRFVRRSVEQGAGLEMDAVEPLRAIASLLAIMFALTHLGDSTSRST
ncbi:MAG: GAF domain-containing protein [Brevundimonas sp.]|nr:GAF domain-containing protein [Brevundimonas sp.]